MGNINIILSGTAGSGKDTLARKLKSEYHFHILTPGELYREEAKNKTELGLKAKEYWDTGSLCPDDMTNTLIKNTINSINQAHHFIMNGYPRTLNQAQFLDQEIGWGDKTMNAITIHLNIPEEVAISRLSRRGRLDDKPEVIKKRFLEFNKNIESVLDYYIKLNRLYEINTNRQEEVVFQRALEIILTNIK